MRTHKQLVAVILLLLLPAFAFAANTASLPVDTGVLDQLVQTFHNSASAWIPQLKRYAASLFWLLVAIDFAWHTINQALEGSEFQGLVGGMMKKVMAYGFFYFVLEQADTWMPAIIGSFTQIGQSVGGGLAVGPSTVMDQGLATIGAIQQVMQQYSMITSAPTVIVFGIVMICILVAYMVAAGQLLVCLVETYIAGSASIIMLGMGGSKWTLDYVQKVLGFTIGAGMKLFVMYLVISIGLPLMNNYLSIYQSTGGQGGITQALGLLAVAGIFTFLCFQVPTLASSVLTGSVSMTLGSMMATAATFAAGAAGAVGLGGGAGLDTVKNVVGLKDAVGAASALSGAGVGSTAGNLLKSALSDVGQKMDLGGNGAMTGRMADSMNAAAQGVNMQNAAPPAPPSPPTPPAPPASPSTPDTTSASVPASSAPSGSASAGASPAPASAPAPSSTGSGSAGSGGQQPKTVADLMSQLQNTKPGATINDSASATAPTIQLNH